MKTLTLEKINSLTAIFILSNEHKGKAGIWARKGHKLESEEGCLLPIFNSCSLAKDTKLERQIYLRHLNLLHTMSGSLSLGSLWCFTHYHNKLQVGRNTQNCVLTSQAMTQKAIGVIWHWIVVKPPKHHAGSDTGPRHQIPRYWFILFKASHTVFKSLRRSCTTFSILLVSFRISILWV